MNTRLPPAAQKQEAQKVRELFLRILYRSLYDWLIYRGSAVLQKRRDAASGYRWLFVDNEPSYLFSFHSMCVLFDKDPEEVRRWAMELGLRKVAALYRGAHTSYWNMDG